VRGSKLVITDLNIRDVEYTEQNLATRAKEEFVIAKLLKVKRATQWHCKSRHYATSRRVTGLRPNEVMELFQLSSPSSLIRFTQPLTEMSTRKVYFWRIGCSRHVRVPTSSPSPSSLPRQFEILKCHNPRNLHGLVHG
jgi:hypothetical protein